MIPDGYPYAVGFEWSDPARYLRIRQVLEEARSRGRKLRVADMQDLQSDVVSLLAQDLQRLLRAARAAPDAAGEAQDMVRMMLDWDGALRVDSPQAALFEFWVHDLQREVTALLVPQSAREALGDVTRVRLARELDEPATGIIGSSAARDALLLRTLNEARARLVAARGPDVAQWAWGAMHTVTFRHGLDGFPVAAALFDRGPLRRSGDGEVVQATSFSDGSFDQDDGASYREIFDLADWDASVGINVPGQSGQPAARHYDDLLPMWLEGRYFPLSYSRKAVDAVTSDLLELIPR
jgi:penicillin amidase